MGGGGAHPQHPPPRYAPALGNKPEKNCRYKLNVLPAG